MAPQLPDMGVIMKEVASLILQVFWVNLATAIFTLRVSAATPSEPIYFILGTPLIDEVCVVPLIRPDDIVFARTAIRTGDGQQMLKNVRIEDGIDGINRNYQSPNTTEWPWHIVEFLGLSSGTTGFGGGIPQIHENLDFLLSPQVDGRVVFLSDYTFVHELGPRMHLTVRAAGEDFEILWAGAGPGYLYTLEFTDSLSAPEWRPVSGAQWPLNVAKWTVITSQFQDRFYRVRATLPEPEDSGN